MTPATTGRPPADPGAGPSLPLTGAVGVVVIGRNEGARLRPCLESVMKWGVPVVYADSGSRDGSVEVAREIGVEPVELDPSRPFSAARGRNEGFERLMDLSRRTGADADRTAAGAAEVEERGGRGGGAAYVQFVDGDCELDARWPEHAARTLEGDPGLALVCGRLREKHRDASLYARLSDMEWQGPTGPIEQCGGLFMIRADAFRAVGGFIAGHVAGEEPDLCARLIKAGWRLARIDAEMGTHDAGMTRFGQWWRRAVRAGWADAKAAWPGNAETSPRARHRIVSTLTWAVAIPLAAAVATVVGPLPLGAAAWAGALLAYAALFVRVRGHRRRAGNTPADAGLYAAFCVLGKWPETIGFVRYWTGAVAGVRIEK